jgi:DNA-binding response OmpR family regulator
MDVLIMERDDLLASTIADVLDDEGISAVVLSDEEALALPPGDPPRVVVTDMNRGHSENLLAVC